MDEDLEHRKRGDHDGDPGAITGPRRSFMEVVMEDLSEHVEDFAWSDLVIFVAACWIGGALLLSPLSGIHWLVPGDFKYRTAMYYHGLMVPVLILLYLLTVNILPLKVLNRRIYGIGAISSILFVGLGSMFNFKKGLSAASLVQITGMVMTDILGIVLAVALVAFAIQDEKISRINTPFRVVLSSMVAILAAALLGHLSGWTIDLGIKSFPGATALLHATGMKPLAFHEGLLSSHSHLMVFAVLCWLVAITAIAFGYQSLTGWKRCVSTGGVVDDTDKYLVCHGHIPCFSFFGLGTSPVFCIRSQRSSP